MENKIDPWVVKFDEKTGKRMRQNVITKETEIHPTLRDRGLYIEPVESVMTILDSASIVPLIIIFCYSLWEFNKILRPMLLLTHFLFDIWYDLWKIIKKIIKAIAWMINDEFYDESTDEARIDKNAGCDATASCDYGSEAYNAGSIRDPVFNTVSGNLLY